MALSPAARSICAFACVALLACASLAFAAPVFAGEQPGTPIEITGPAGSEFFGLTVEILPNGNVVICDPGFDKGAVENVGAVYLYEAESLELISTLTGSQEGDWVCYSGLTLLANGNFVVQSHLWDNGSIADAGAVTFVNGESGLDGVVSPSNSLVGSHDNDKVGQTIAVAGNSSSAGVLRPAGDHTEILYYQGVAPLPNGNYVVNAENWDNGAIEDAGASTWANGETGISGTISLANSLVGENTLDRVGDFVTLVGTSNYVVQSPGWDAPGAADVGAATWVNGDTGIKGTVGSINSLVGSQEFDYVGERVVVLDNGNYVVESSSWSSATAFGVGAVTWARGDSGIAGAVSPANSLVGSQDGDAVGNIYALANGNYVVLSGSWDNGATADVGAATLGNGTTGIKGAVTTANSLYGSSPSDRVGSYITLLTNGNYVVNSPDWANGAATRAGAATWGDGDTGIVGPVTKTNSIYGETADSRVGYYGFAALTNGNYVVCSPFWNAGNPAALNLGAATWGDGESGTAGAVSAANSLVGSTADDGVCANGVSPLANGNYVVPAFSWDNGAIANVGAVTWGNGETGTSGAVSASNSLVGGGANDAVGVGLDVLPNGNYVVRSPLVDVGGVENAGAATWGNGAVGTIGTVSASNSLVGVSANDNVGVVYFGFGEQQGAVVPLANGSYVVRSPNFDHNGKTDVGALTWSRANGSTLGPVGNDNSIFGSTAGDQIGWGKAIGLGNSSFYLASPSWQNPDAALSASPMEHEGVSYQSGAVTYGSGRRPLVSVVSPENSFLGESADGAFPMRLLHMPGWEMVVVSFPLDNRVILSPSDAFAEGDPIYLSLISGNE